MYNLFVLSPITPPPTHIHLLRSRNLVTRLHARSTPLHLPHTLVQHAVGAFQVRDYPFQPLEQDVGLVPLRLDAARQRLVLRLRRGDLRRELGVGRGQVGG